MINDLSKENNFLNISLFEESDFSTYSSDTDIVNNKNIDKEEKYLNIDFTFPSLFIALPIGITSIAGAISGKAISRSGCCINCIDSGLDSVARTYILTTADYSLINQPYSNLDVSNYLINIIPNIMRGITVFSTLGLGVGSLWYDLEDKTNLYQHVITLVSTLVIAPGAFYLAESYTSNIIENNLQYVGELEL